ncbi:hypothetical protein AMTR_s03332p00005600, partial [Amborella trichopoda]
GFNPLVIDPHAVVSIDEDEATFDPVPLAIDNSDVVMDVSSLDVVVFENLV